MQKRQRTLVNLAVLYGMCMVFAVFLILRNPLTVARIDEPTLYELAANGDVRDLHVFYMGLRDFYTADVLIATQDVVDLLEIDERFTYFTHIPTLEIASVDFLAETAGEALAEYINEDDNITLRFITADSPTLVAYRQDTTIIVMGRTE